MKLLRSILYVRWPLNLLLMLSLALCFKIEFDWRNDPPFMGWAGASKLGDIVSNLCLAYVASWMFFFVKDHWESHEKGIEQWDRLQNCALLIFQSHDAFMLKNTGIDLHASFRAKEPALTENATSMRSYGTDDQMAARVQNHFKLNLSYLRLASHTSATLPTEWQDLLLTQMAYLENTLDEVDGDSFISSFATYQGNLHAFFGKLWFEPAITRKDLFDYLHQGEGRTFNN